MKSVGNNSVTTIILTWNSASFIADCLRSVIDSGFPTNIVVVDNDSSDNTRALVSRKFPEVTLINTGDNLGYAGGNNYAMRLLMAGPADYFFILNPDATIYPGCLEMLQKRMESEPQLAAASPMVYQSSDKRIWDAGGEINWKNGQTPHIGDGQLDTGQFDTKAYTARMNGCAMLVRKSVLQTVGLFDESYFLYFEETDWSVACLNAGYKLGFVPQAKAYHAASAATGGQHSPVYEYYLTRNRLYFMHKHRDKASKSYLLRISYVQCYNLLATLRVYGWKPFLRALRYQVLGTRDYFLSHLGRQVI